MGGRSESLILLYHHKATLNLSACTPSLLSGRSGGRRGQVLGKWLIVLGASLRGCMELAAEALSPGRVLDVVCATTPMSRLLIVGR